METKIRPVCIEDGSGQMICLSGEKPSLPLKPRQNRKNWRQQRLNGRNGRARRAVLNAFSARRLCNIDRFR
jgi:hypothetical protein